MKPTDPTKAGRWRRRSGVIVAGSLALVAGALFPAGDPDALAKTIQDVDANRERYDTYGRQARTTYEQRHDPRRNVDQLLDIYRFAMTQPMSAGRDRVGRR